MGATLGICLALSEDCCWLRCCCGRHWRRCSRCFGADKAEVFQSRGSLTHKEATSTRSEGDAAPRKGWGTRD